MRKGKLDRSKWHRLERHSSGGKVKIDINAYQTDCNGKEFGAKYRIQYSIFPILKVEEAYRTGFSSMEEAFDWAEGHIDYEHNDTKKN